MPLPKLTRLRVNLLSNFVGQGYVSVVGLVVLPVYLAWLGPEAFGLVGFYLVMETLLLLLDLGMSPTLTREISTAQTVDQSQDDLRRKLRSIEVVFVSLGLAIAVGGYLFAPEIAAHWIGPSGLGQDTVTDSIVLIGFTLGVRLTFVMYWAALVGQERQFLLNLIQVVFITLRLPGALVVLHLTDNSLTAYFQYQLALVALQAILFAACVYRALPRKNHPVWLFYPSSVRPMMAFAASTAYLAAIGVLTTNIDRLILSKALTLAEFGYFTLVVTICAAIETLSAPVRQAVLPRLSAFHATSDQAALENLYGHAARFVAYLMCPFVIVLVVYPEAAIFAWTGDLAAAEWCKTVLPWFALAYILRTITAFTFYLQYAYGDLKLQLRFSTGLAIVCMPLIILLAEVRGPAEIGLLWVLVRAAELLLWMPYVHRRFLSTPHPQWVVMNVVPPALGAALLAGLLFQNLQIEPQGQFDVALQVATIGGGAGILALLAFWTHLQVGARLRSS